MAPVVGQIGYGGQSTGLRKMTAHTKLAVTSRDRFLEAAKKELIAFEQREREFREKDWQERALKLRIRTEIAEPRHQAPAATELM